MRYNLNVVRIQADVIVIHIFFGELGLVVKYQVVSVNDWLSGYLVIYETVCLRPLCNDNLAELLPFLGTINE